MRKKLFVDAYCIMSMNNNYTFKELQLNKILSTAAYSCFRIWCDVVSDSLRGFCCKSTPVLDSGSILKKKKFCCVRESVKSIFKFAKRRKQTITPRLLLWYHSFHRKTHIASWIVLHRNDKNFHKVNLTWNKTLPEMGHQLSHNGNAFVAKLG